MNTEKNEEKVFFFTTLSIESKYFVEHNYSIKHI